MNTVIYKEWTSPERTNDDHIRAVWVSKDCRTSLIAERGSTRLDRDRISGEAGLYDNLNMRELVCRCQAGETGAFEVLVKRHQREVFNLLYQLAPDWTDIADLSQEVFIRVWKSIKYLHDPGRFRGWLRQIVTHLFYDELRKRPKYGYTLSLDQPLEFDDSSTGLSRDIVDNHGGPDEQFQNAELAQAIRSAMARLPVQFRMAIILRECDGLSYDEIAELTHAEIGTVKSRIARARAKLQKLLANYQRQHSSCQLEAAG